VKTETRQSSPAKRRTPLSRQRVVAAALDYVDEHGLDNLTMHNLATQLAVGDMSLYNHVRNKDDLLAGISDLVWAEVAVAVPPDASDADWLRALGRAIRLTGQRHRKAIPAVVGGSGVFPPAMLEAIAAQFGRDGSHEADPRLVNGMGTVAAFALGWAIMTTRGAESERQRISRVTRALPPDTPDRLVDTAITVCARDLDALFDSGLEAVINGSGLGDTTTRSRIRRQAANPSR
jgi:AcrR family transcriptional regulator